MFPGKIQISLRIRAFWIGTDTKYLKAGNEESD